MNISPFIDNLPYDKPTSSFSSEDASGSTSQATNIQEALEVGCSTLLIDEDTCATNFMIRDERMQALIQPDKEPITPFIFKVRNIYASLGTSSVLVIGGCGEYFDVADQVIMMDAFVPHDVTAQAKAISVQFATATATATASSFALPLSSSATPPLPPSHMMTKSTRVFPSPTHRYVVNILSSNQRDAKLAVRNRFLIQIGDLDLQLSGVEQLCDTSQTRSIADCLVYLSQQSSQTTRRQTLASLLDHLEEAFDSPQGLDVLFSPGRLRGNCARPRRFEIAAAINRLRLAKFSHSL